MSRPKDLKFAMKFTGWYGEDCYKAEGKRFIKRLVNRINRHFYKSQLRKELNCES